MLRGCLETVLFLLPVLVFFLPALWRRRHPWQVYLAGGFFVLGGLTVWQLHEAASWFAPYLEGVMPFLNFGVISADPNDCCSAMHVGVAHRYSYNAGSVGSATSDRIPLSNRAVGTLLLPFFLAYLGLIAPRAGFDGIWDRYVIPLLFIAVVFTLRFYEQQIGVRLPMAALVLVICFGAYATAASHDQMAMYRARVAALNEVLATGIPRTSVSGGWDYDGWTELQLSSYVNGGRMRVPAGATLPTPTHYGLANCPWFYCAMFPHVVPRYTISLRPDPITEGRFQPVPYRTWMLPAGTVYVVPFPDRLADGRVP